MTEPNETDEWGIDAAYVDAHGARQRIDPAVVGALREIIGRPPPGPPSTLVLRPGAALPGGRGPAVEAVLELEEGGELAVAGRLPADTPFGYHTLRPGDGSPGTDLIVSPGRAHLPEGLRAWGWAAQLYATRSARSWGIGDLGDLARLARWSAQTLGAAFVLVNPMHATAPAAAQQPSPYFPATRRFRNPLYLRVEDVPGAAAAAGEVEAAATAGRALNDSREIDRDAIWALKLRALEAIWTRGAGDDAEFAAFFADAPDALREFATWATLTERLGPDWREWPADYRRPDAPGVARAAADDRDRIRFHAWLQWLTERQLAAAAEHLMVIQDLPIGVDPGGADAWAWQEMLAPDVTVGAPPDEFNRAGQDWGLPPFVPWRLAAAGYRPFIDTIRAGLASGGGLRVDHVMGLFRLWWVPGAADPAGGAYVRYPAEDLLDIVALESCRAGAVVIGEDLGTVEESAREAMSRHNVLSYRLLWFEQDEPAAWPAAAMAAVTTHDLPTVAGLWDGSDLTAQQDAGVDPNTESTEAIRAGLATSGGLDEGASAQDAVLAAHRLLAEAPSALLCATLDDAVGEAERPNIPGGDGKRPNWSLALPVPLEEIEEHPLANGVASLLAAAVRAR